MSNGWTDAELAASVAAYKEMAAKQASGTPVNKAQVYRELAAAFGRNEGAFERRMQNISAVYAELGLEWIKGLRPAVNVGNEIKARLLAFIQGDNTEHAVSVKYKHGDKRTWELVREAVTAYGGSARRSEVKSWITQHYPNYNENNLVDLEVLSVNSPSRTSYSQNAKPRLTNSGSPYDRLFKVPTEKSLFVTYSPEVHGIWEIYPDASARNRFGMGVRRVDDPIATGLENARAEVEASDAFNPSTIEDARKKVLAEIVRRQGQSGFRKALIKAYDSTCAITGCTLLPILEAAHVHPYRGKQTNVPSNGLLLRADIHTLFDLNLLAIDSATLTVLVAPELADTEYAALQGKSIRQAQYKNDRISVEALDWHRSLCAW
ncbi:MAG: hypothetical protein GAK45_00066 [Pseudomonas citronellolis]|nr:MAG: hypothetical protein GAK45_00066 [Pseudomonas citronellolis]